MTQPTNAVEKTILLMELLATSENPLSLREMESRTGISRSAVHRTMQSLESYGWAEKDSLRGHYRPGMGFFFLSGQENSFESLLSLGIPLMERLVQETHQTALISVLEGHQGRCIATVPSPRALQFVAKKGMVFPLNGGATGKVLLAYAPEALRHLILEDRPLERYTPRSVVNPRKLEEELEEIRTRGYAFSKEEFMPRTAAISAPLFERKERFLGQVGISGHLEDFKAQEEHLISRVLQAAEDISRGLQRAAEKREVQRNKS